MALQQSARPQTATEHETSTPDPAPGATAGRRPERYGWLAGVVLVGVVVAVAVLMTQVLTRTGDLADQNRQPQLAETTPTADGSFEAAEATRHLRLAPVSAYDQSFQVAEHSRFVALATTARSDRSSDVAEQHRFHALAANSRTDDSFEVAERSRMTALAARGTDRSNEIAEHRRMIRVAPGND